MNMRPCKTATGWKLTIALIGVEDLATGAAQIGPQRGPATIDLHVVGLIAASADEEVSVGRFTVATALALALPLRGSPEEDRRLATLCLQGG